MTNVKKILLISWIVVICGFLSNAIASTCGFVSSGTGSSCDFVSNVTVSGCGSVEPQNAPALARGVKCRSQNSKARSCPNRVCHRGLILTADQSNACKSSQCDLGLSTVLSKVCSLEFDGHWVNTSYSRSANCVQFHTGVPINEVASSIEQEIVPGAERIDLYLHLLKGKSVGLTVNQSSLVQEQHLVDVLIEKDVDVKRIYAPEHGFRGKADAGAKIDDQKDSKTGLTIISLYGKKRKPAQEDLADVDIMVFDIQDVGVRFYTFISTMHLMMEACAEAGIPVIILDRPNPNGYYVDGPTRESEYKSFIGMHPIPVVYGMTIGELAMMINGEGWLDGGLQCDLKVIPCENYDHNMTYDVPVPPSPNLPNLRSILLYPSLCFFEGTNVSVGRGTDNQFQVLGHPEYTPGPYHFTPEPKPGAMHPKSDGVELHGTSLVSLSPSEIMHWRSINLSWLMQYYAYLSDKGEFFLENLFFDKLAGTARLREQIIAGWTESEIKESWAESLANFKVKRKAYLLYQDFE